LCAPPPETISSSTFIRGRTNRSMPSATAAAVSAVAVAINSGSGRPVSSSRFTNAAPYCSRPADFGGAEW
jgi:hypothetical protein